MKSNFTIIENLAVSADAKGITGRAAEFFRQEVWIRAGRSIQLNSSMETNAYLLQLIRSGELEKESFELKKTENGAVIRASDLLGFLYGCAHLLRHMYLKNGVIGVETSLEDCRIVPSYAMRGHQLGYRDKQNTCPAWTEVEYERYIRDLLMFGSNAIELLPPHTDDNWYSCHFKRDPLKLMAKLSEIIHSYGMEVHVWYPYLAETIGENNFPVEMKEREEVFRLVPYIDGLLIPAGDPGDLSPQDMIQAAKETAKLLHQSHPDAKVWIAPQAFAPKTNWYPEFYQVIQNQQDWLYGICFGPWEKDSVKELYEKVPEYYRDHIRNYPDITHNMSCQFEIPDWDEAFSYTLGRESYNPRVKAMRKIHAYHKGYVMGSITYSEGIHDDVNKMLWGSMDYEEEKEDTELVREYVRFLIDPDLEEELTEIICRLEENWTGRIVENAGIDELYEKMMAIDAKADPKTKENYRYQLLLLRVIGDYQTKIRYIHDQKLEEACYEALRDLSSPVEERIRRAKAILHKTDTEPVGVKERYLLQELADRLYQSCGIQLTTTRHRGQNLDRGAWLDTLNAALNDAPWINKILTDAEAKSTEEKEAVIARLCSRCDPGPGGQYIYLGSPEGFQKVVRTVPWEEDPGYLHSPLMAHHNYLIMKRYQNIGWYDEVPISSKWLHGARAIYGTPLMVKVDHLDPDKQYRIAVTYQDLLLNQSLNLRFYAGETLIHSTVTRTWKPGEYWNPVQEFLLPQDSYQIGEVLLRWETYEPLGPVVISELWIREADGL